MNSDPINLPPLNFPPNPLAQVWEAMRELKELNAGMVALAGDTHAQLAAQRALLQALIASHPDPEALSAQYMDQMDLLADLLQSDRVEKYRAEAQRFQGTILQAIRQRPPRKPG